MASQLQISDQLPQRRGLHLKEITTEGGTTTDTLGGLLRSTRLRKGEDLKAAARSTKIKPEYLEALEEGRIDALPGRTYAIGFLRAYAAYLGLDAAECIARFKTETAPATPAPEPTLGFDEKKEPESGLQVSGTVLVLIGLVVLALIWGGIYLFRSANETMDRRAKAQASAPVSHRNAPAPATTLGSTTPADTQTPPVAAAPTTTAPDATTAPATTSTATPAPAGKAKTATDEDVTPPSDDEEATPASPTPAANAAQPPAKTPPATNTTTTTSAPGNAAATGEPAATTFETATAQAPHSYGVAATPGRLVLRATEKVFVRIATTGDRQQVIYQGQLAKGDVFYVPAMDNLVLVTRNGGALDVYLDKTLKGPVGPKGVALSGLALNPDAFQH